MAKHSVEQDGVEKQELGVGGIDVAKNWHYVQWLDVSGRPVGKAFRFANTCAEFEAMWDRRPSDAVRIDMKSTGPYWLGLAHWLRAQGAEVVLVQPAHVHRLKELDDNTPTKTDAKDARVIARLVYDGRWFRWEPRVGAVGQRVIPGFPLRVLGHRNASYLRSSRAAAPRKWRLKRSKPPFARTWPLASRYSAFPDSGPRSLPPCWVNWATCHDSRR
ncbi:IS110 family transposase [Sulfobacillus thermosulfidooxidans]|uniref:IS110 family transposase n=1 Tax=Sulfobacillus thermosulfidooxidans TaxID=28034 RepID=UPI0002FF9B8A|nr:IS110 family transposase [Sulfobacillus thermosulfidooxidans]